MQIDVKAVNTDTLNQSSLESAPVLRSEKKRCGIRNSWFLAWTDDIVGLLNYFSIAIFILRKYTSDPSH